VSNPHKTFAYTLTITENTKSCPQLRSVPYYNVLWAYLSDSVLNIVHAQSTSKDTVKPHTMTYTIPPPSLPTASLWVSSLLSRSYGPSQRRKRIKVLINPFGGKGTAAKLYATHIAPIFTAAQCIVDVVHTTHAKHAEELARELDVSQWDVVACASGDGIPHEVFNGLAAQARPQHALHSVAVTQLPCGSGNGMSWNLHGTGSPSLAALSIVKGRRMPMDLVSITQGGRRTLSFLSQAVGIIAESDLGTEGWRWMGDTRFTVGYVLRLMRQTVWPVDFALGIEIDSKAAVKEAYAQYVDAVAADAKGLTSPRSSASGADSSDAIVSDDALPPLKYGTVSDPLPTGWTLTPYPNLGNFYAGNMAYMTADSPAFATSLPADGMLDLMMVDGDISRMRALQLADEVGKGTLIDAPEVNYLKVSGYRIVPRLKEGYISIDGERIPFEGFQAEVHKGLGCVLSKSGVLYEAKGPQRVN
jgi:sphingosine kinase